MIKIYLYNTKYKNKRGVLFMAIGKDKTQLMLTLTKEDKAKLQEIAEKESRTVNNLIVVIIKEFLKTQS